MPMPAYLWLKDEQGGEIKGSVRGEREGSIEILAFDHEVRTPTDVHSGDITGIRVHEAVKIVKAFDASTTCFYQAVCKGKTFSEAVIRWYNIDKNGQEIEYFNHKLENVKISSVKPKMYNIKDASKERYIHLEEIEMRYEKITWKYLDGNLIATDSWEEE